MLGVEFMFANLLKELPFLPKSAACLTESWPFKEIGETRPVSDLVQGIERR